MNNRLHPQEVNNALMNVGERIARSFKRFGKTLAQFAAAMDTSPSNLLWTEVSELRREVNDLRTRANGQAQCSTEAHHCKAPD